ncbi:hypothetical protein C3F34_16790 [Acinetobacter sp. ACNIH2]|uniref:hypothetical protein n=1 Tax=Acinetobacter sp. ACNIH2 TaxID=1758189 RepID=UPI000CDBF81A|nr:hypothetical protein [Acinetobacter sp. ACNIH2]AUX87541.1 hypothetical protein C3F34_16790 [Acinetobacter sp. ACNIH2]
MKKVFKQIFPIILLSFSLLFVVPLIAWLVIQAVISMGHFTDLYVSFLGNYFIEPVAQLVASLSILLFLGSIIFACIVAFCEWTE